MTSRFNQTHFIQLLILWFPISFLLIRHGVHVSLYVLLLLYIYELINGRAKFLFDSQALLITLALSSIFFATAAQQILTGELNWSAFDGPSRLLIAGLVFQYLLQKKISTIRYLEIAIPTGLICLLIYLGFMNQTHFWGRRWANIFVDPNSLGTQSTILSMICLLSITKQSKLPLNILKILGFLAGLYISIKTESRGGWISVPVMLATWFIIQIKQDQFFSDKKKRIEIIGLCLLLTLGFIALGLFSQTIKHRVLITIIEIQTWVRDPTVYTSAGSRLSMWVASFQLITENWLGYGEITLKEILVHHTIYAGIHHHGAKDLIYAGPHSDLLSKGLSLGMLGILSYLSSILIPALLFLRHINKGASSVRLCAQIGLMYVCAVLTVGLFNETLSLKYLCSFYGLILACLASEVLMKNSLNTHQEKTYA